MRKSKNILAMVMIVALFAVTLLAFVGCADVGELSVISAQYETTDEGQLWQFKIHWEYGEEVPYYAVGDALTWVRVKNSATKKINVILDSEQIVPDKVFFDTAIPFTFKESSDNGITFAFEILLEQDAVLDLDIKFLPKSQKEIYDNRLNDDKEPRYETIKLKLTTTEI